MKPKVWGAVFLYVLGSGLASTVEAQFPSVPAEQGSEPPHATGTPPGPVPFAGYEERLRQSLQWERMSSEEREQALQKIQRLREQFQRRQQQVEAQYKSLLETSKTAPRVFDEETKTGFAI